MTELFTTFLINKCDCGRNKRTWADICHYCNTLLKSKIRHAKRRKTKEDRIRSYN